MGIIRNGGNGAFSGKAGSFIGSSWKGVDYIKGLPKLSKKPATQQQLEQRAKFAAVLSYLSPLKSILNIGFESQTKNRATGYNMGIQYALNHAIAGSYPDYIVDRTKVLLSKGGLTPPMDLLLTSTATAKLSITFSTMVNGATAYADDNLIVVVYDPAKNLMMPYLNAAQRADGHVDIDLPNEFSGEEVEVTLFYRNRNGKTCSTSIHMAAINIQ